MYRESLKQPTRSRLSTSSGQFPADSTVTTVLGVKSLSKQDPLGGSLNWWLKSSWPPQKRKSAINQTKQLKCKMWTWLLLGGRTQTLTDQFSFRTLQTPAPPLSFKLSCSTLWTVKFTFILFQPTYTIEVYAVAAGCPFDEMAVFILVSCKIKQQPCEKILWQPILTVFRHMHEHPLLTFQNHLPVIHTSSSRSQGVSVGGWRALHFPSPMVNKTLLIMPQEYKINILNNKLKNKTVLQRTSWTV